MTELHPVPARTWTQRFDAYERLVRLDKPIGILLLLWPTLTAVWLAAVGLPTVQLIVVFLVGVATLALVALPYALGDRPTGLDRWVSYGFLAIVGWIFFAWRKCGDNIPSPWPVNPIKERKFYFKLNFN